MYFYQNPTTRKTFHSHILERRAAFIAGCSTATYYSAAFHGGKKLQTTIGSLTVYKSSPISTVESVI